MIDHGAAYDSLLINVYLPRMREAIGAPNLHWIPEDGRILIWNARKRRYSAIIGAIAPDGEFIFGRLHIEEKLVDTMRGHEGSFIKALGRELAALTRDLHIEWLKHL